MRILGIETSCDEIAASIVEDGTKVLSSVIASSLEEHKKTDGIIPEIAARIATEKIHQVYQKALEAAKLSWSAIDALAVTAGPGLMGSLLVGIEVAKTLAYIHKKPLIPVQHIAGHICSTRLGEDDFLRFPALVLTVSGGHNDLVLWKGDYDFELLGNTIDDAAGEAFDKGARILGLPFPGGPSISKCAEIGNPKAFAFPRPMLQKPNYQFSFSGLKTALLYEAQKHEKMTPDLQADLAASYQEAIVDSLLGKLKRASEEYQTEKIFITGGVSANMRLREKALHILESPLNKGGLGDCSIHFPPSLEYCTDNAAMIAGAAYWKWKQHPEQAWNWEEVEPKLSKAFF